MMMTYRKQRKTWWDLPKILIGQPKQLVQLFRMLNKQNKIRMRRLPTKRPMRWTLEVMISQSNPWPLAIINPASLLLANSPTMLRTIRGKEMSKINLLMTEITHSVMLMQTPHSSNRQRRPRANFVHNITH